MEEGGTNNSQYWFGQKWTKHKMTNKMTKTDTAGCLPVVSVDFLETRWISGVLTTAERGDDDEYTDIYLTWPHIHPRDWRYILLYGVVYIII